MNKQWLFSAGVAEIISGRKSPPAQTFLWDFVKIYHEIIALLSDTPEGRQLTGYQWAGRQDNAQAAKDYFNCVFRLPLPRVTDKLQDILRSHCTAPDKRQEKNLSRPSLWQIVQRAGGCCPGVGEMRRQPVYYRPRRDKAAFTALHISLHEVICRAGRFYAEVCRLGLYPPEVLRCGEIKPAQVRKLRILLNSAREQAGAAGRPEQWREYLQILWRKDTLPRHGQQLLQSPFSGQ